MKTSIAVIAFTITATAKDLTLQWDPPPITEGITNYAIYASTSEITAANFLSAPFRYNAGTSTTFTITNLAPARWYFTAVSEADGMMSDTSNILRVNVPGKPENLRR